jgi:hypothetical protein
MWIALPGVLAVSMLVGRMQSVALWQISILTGLVLAASTGWLFAGHRGRQLPGRLGFAVGFALLYLVINMAVGLGLYHAGFLKDLKKPS